MLYSFRAEPTAKQTQNRVHPPRGKISVRSCVHCQRRNLGVRRVGACSSRTTDIVGWVGRSPRDSRLTLSDILSSHFLMGGCRAAPAPTEFTEARSRSRRRDASL